MLENQADKLLAMYNKCFLKTLTRWAYKRDGSFVRTKMKQYSQLQNIFYLYNLKTDKIKYLLVPLHNWIEIGIEIASTHIKCMEKRSKKLSAQEN